MSQDKKKILFIINPIAGVKSKKNIPEIIEESLDPRKTDYTIQLTESAGHGIELAKNATDNGFDVVVAVGGDGTINEVAKGLVGSTVALGLVPMGSGNGLARHLGIPLTIKDAVKLFNEGDSHFIDVGYVNNELFLCTAGVGFDAEIAHQFDIAKGRGFFTYARCVLSNFMKYKEDTYQLKRGDQVIQHTAFNITFANASQYGNGIYISPHSNIADGKMEACVLMPVKWWQLPSIWWALRGRKIERSSLFKKYEAQSFLLERQSEGFVHLDGEPQLMGKAIKVILKPSALKVIIKTP